MVIVHTAKFGVVVTQQQVSEANDKGKATARRWHLFWDLMLSNSQAHQDEEKADQKGRTSTLEQEGAWRYVRQATQTGKTTLWRVWYTFMNYLETSFSIQGSHCNTFSRTVFQRSLLW